MPVLTRFLSTEDGIRLAWADHGDGEPLVLARGWITHIELSWEDLPFRRFVEALACSVRVVRYDHRGMGLSDRDVPAPDLDTLVTDLEAVIDAVGTEPVVLWGSLFGGPIAIRYAARHPERVSKLMLDSTWVRPADLQSDPEIDRVHREHDRHDARRAEPALATYSYLSDPAPESRHEDRVERVRRSIAPNMLADLYHSVAEMDVEREAAGLDVPTLVLHRRECSLPLVAGQRVASTIKGSQFVGLDGRSTNLWEGDAATPLHAMSRFLGLAQPEVSGPEGRGIAVLLMTDLVESTATTARLGDDDAHPLQQFHDDAVRAALASTPAPSRCTRATGSSPASRRQQPPCGARTRSNRASPAATQSTTSSCTCASASTPASRSKGGARCSAPRCRRQQAGLRRGRAQRDPRDAGGEGARRGQGFTFEDRGEQSLKGFAEPVHLTLARET